jgi:hypothetical protein
MRTLAGLSAALLFASALFGQYHYGAPIVTGGFGNAVYPAGTAATNPAITRFIPNAVYPGGGGPRLVVPGSTRRAPVKTRPGAVVVPYAYPVYVGSGYTDGSYAQAPPAQQPNVQQPNVTVVYPPQPAPVMVSQFGPGATPPGADPEPVAAPADDQPPADHYFLALKDHSVYSVVAYWVDGDTLHYFTPGNVHNQASISLVDRDLTARLNKESGLSVDLPDAK